MPKEYRAPVVVAPSLATIVVPVPVRAWYQPGIVELFVQVADPLVGSESKFCVYGVPIVDRDTWALAGVAQTRDVAISARTEKVARRVFGIREPIISWYCGRVATWFASGDEFLSARR